jgi:transposase
VGVTLAPRKLWEVSDELWTVIEPLLPKHERRFRYPGRKRIDDHKTPGYTGSFRRHANRTRKVPDGAVRHDVLALEGEVVDAEHARDAQGG